MSGFSQNGDANNIDQLEHSESAKGSSICVRMGDGFDGQLQRYNIWVCRKDDNERVMKITFHRGLRQLNGLANENEIPPALGEFPIHSVDDYAKFISDKMDERRGIFIPIYQREAMWIELDAHYPLAIRIYAGGINIVNGLPKVGAPGTIAYLDQLEIIKNPIMDHIVTGPGVDKPHRIVGINNGVCFKQFIATPLASARTVEEQIAGQSSEATLEIEIIPAKFEVMVAVKVISELGHHTTLSLTSYLPVAEIKIALENLWGIRAEDQTLLCKKSSEPLKDKECCKTHDIKTGDTLLMAIRESSAEATATIDKTAGQIEIDDAEDAEIGDSPASSDDEPDRDGLPANIWDMESIIRFHVQLLNAYVVPQITGLPPPPTDITEMSYDSWELNFFREFDEHGVGRLRRESQGHNYRSLHPTQHPEISHNWVWIGNTVSMEDEQASNVEPSDFTE